jgi:hypothetical protein
MNIRTRGVQAGATIAEMRRMASEKLPRVTFWPKSEKPIAEADCDQPTDNA